MAEQRRGRRGGAGRGRKARQFTRGAAVKIGAVAFHFVRRGLQIIYTKGVLRVDYKHGRAYTVFIGWQWC